MCGIAGFIIKDPSSSIDREALADELLIGIDHRGGDATGFVARNREGHLEWQKASTDVKGFLRHRRALPVDADVCLLHTRWATQGDKAFPENNHPVKRGAMFVIHNGVVYNDRELFAATGRKPYGQVDSEALAALLSHEGKLDEKAAQAFASVDGSAAIAALDERDGTVMLARISSSPLHVLTTRRVTIFASTASAVQKAHEAAIGSLGRAKVTELREGDARFYRDGDAQAFTFQVPAWSYVKKAAPKGNETTGSYLPRIAAVDCEICNQPLDDSYDLWDGDDVYDVCAGCWSAYTDPRDYQRGKQWLTL